MPNVSIKVHKSPKTFMLLVRENDSNHDFGSKVVTAVLCEAVRGFCEINNIPR